MSIELPVLSFHPSYILPVSKGEYGICGLVSFENGCFEKVRFIDSLGQEWFVEAVENCGYINWFQYLFFNENHKAIRVSFKLKQGHKYSFLELKNEIEKFLMSKRLSGSPFANKAKEVPEYLRSFKTISNLVSGLGYFDARKSTYKKQKYGYSYTHKS